MSSFGSYQAYGGGGGRGFCTTASGNYNNPSNLIASAGGNFGWDGNDSFIGTFPIVQGNGNIMSNGGFGNNGGSGYQDTEGSGNDDRAIVGGGGGGAGGVGQNAIPNSTVAGSLYTGKAGDGGAGKQINILSSSGGNFYGGGGGGAGANLFTDISGLGGTGGGGAGNSGGVGVIGVVNTGGGGGAGGFANQFGGVGGSGIIIIKYKYTRPPAPQVQTINSDYKYFSFPQTSIQETPYNITFQKNTQVQLLVASNSFVRSINPFTQTAGKINIIVGNTGGHSSYGSTSTSTETMPYFYIYTYIYTYIYIQRETEKERD